MSKFIFLLLLFTSALLSNENLANKKIKLLGEKKDVTLKRVSLKEIEKINLVEYTIIDPYTKIKTRYSGVLLKDFANKFGKEDINSIIFKAIDGYEVTIKKNDWLSFTVLLTTRIDGKYVGYENKGPLRIVFPKYKVASENFTNNLPKWIWMIKSIEFKK